MRSFKHSASVLYPKPLCRYGRGGEGLGECRAGWQWAGEAGVALDGVFPLVFISDFGRSFSSQAAELSGKKETYYSSKQLIRVCGEIFPDNFVSLSAGNWDL